MDFDNTYMSDEMALSLIVDLIRHNPSQELNRYVKGAHNFKSKFDNKKIHVCQHLYCRSPSCGSHEISDGIFLKPMANVEGDVCMLSPDFSGNGFRLSVKKLKSRYASIFPGYCGQHDNALFKSFENDFRGINSSFVHNQVLRTVRKEIFLKSSHLLKLRETLSECGFDNISKRKRKGNREYFYIKKRIRSLGFMIGTYKKLYRKVWKSIDGEISNIYYKVIDLPAKQMAFAGVLSGTSEGKTQHLFIYILPGETNKLILATLNDTSDFVDEFVSLKEFAFYSEIQEIILNNYDRLIFSEKFFDNLSEAEKTILMDGPHCRNPLGKYMLKLLN